MLTLWQSLSSHSSGWWNVTWGTIERPKNRATKCKSIFPLSVSCLLILSLVNLSKPVALSLTWCMSLSLLMIALLKGSSLSVVQQFIIQLYADFPIKDLGVFFGVEVHRAYFLCHLSGKNMSKISYTQDKHASRQAFFFSNDLVYSSLDKGVHQNFRIWNSYTRIRIQNFGYLISNPNPIQKGCYLDQSVKPNSYQILNWNQI